MSILTAENLGLSFGAFDLFKGISGAIANDSKIGLIGPNGVGKTSLLLILAGINAPSAGKVTLARGRRLGYLRQEAVDAFANRQATVYQEMLTVFKDLQDRQNELLRYEEQMTSGEISDSLLETYGNLQEEYEKLGGYDYELRIQQTLSGLGLEKKDWTTSINHLSGGQKTRALLARLLLEKPDLLMLDEPTNHLDIQAVEWLERILRDWDGAVIIVSHDRFFLDNTVNTIWEMTPTGIQVYPGGYSAYLTQRQERWEYAEKVCQEEKERLLKEVDFVQRNWVRASTHARALGVLRRLTRDLAVIDAYGVLALRNGQKWSEFDLHADRPLDVIEAIRKVNAIQIPGNRPPVIRPRLAGNHLSGNLVLRTYQLSVGYPQRLLFSPPDIELRRGECAAIIGPNGSGKTSFLKTLLEEIPPLAGRIQLGSGLNIGYFAQAHESLNPEKNVLDELLERSSMDSSKARNVLAQYLFRGEDVFKKIISLSGGERARLALAILAQTGANFLLLDEPTNHLDIPAREALQEVLEGYDGTILLVSHDRFLIDRLATQIWELDGGQLRIFNGQYRNYLLRRTAPGTVKGGIKQTLLPNRPLVHDNSKETRRRMENLALIESRIQEQEKTIQSLSTQLQKAGEAHETAKINDLSWKIARAQVLLDQLMEEWEQKV